MVEFDPVYCDRILTRWEAYAGDEAELVERRVDAGEPTPQERSGGRGGTDASPARPLSLDDGFESRPDGELQPTSTRKSRTRRSAAAPTLVAPNAPPSKTHTQTDTTTEERSQ